MSDGLDQPVGLFTTHPLTPSIVLIVIHLYEMGGITKVAKKYNWYLVGGGNSGRLKICSGGSSHEDEGLYFVAAFIYSPGQESRVRILKQACASHCCEFIFAFIFWELLWVCLSWQSGKHDLDSLLTCEVLWVLQTMSGKNSLDFCPGLYMGRFHFS